MKRRIAYLDLSRAAGGFEGAYLALVRVLGVNKKTGQLWVKGWGLRTQLVNAEDVGQ